MAKIVFKKFPPIVPQPPRIGETTDEFLGRMEMIEDVSSVLDGECERASIKAAEIAERLYQAGYRRRQTTDKEVETLEDIQAREEMFDDADNDIIKALDILDKLDFFNQRAGRELWSVKPIDVQNEDIENFSKDIVWLKDFINRQKAEIEQYIDYNDKLLEENDSLKVAIEAKDEIFAETLATSMKRADIIAEQKAEIERLHNILLSFTNEVSMWSNKKGYDTSELSLIPILDKAKNIKAEVRAEAITEFAERLKLRVESIPWCECKPVQNAIDELAKEMKEGVGE